MREYELLYITHADYDEEQIAAVISRYNDVITNGSGIVKSAEKWGKRRLAYEIKDCREGLYILTYLEAPKEVAAEIDRLMKIDQDILRHMITRLDNIKLKKRTPRQPLRRNPEPLRVEPTPEAPAKVTKEAPESAPAEASVTAGQAVPQESIEPK